MISNGGELFPVTGYSQFLLIPDTEGTKESVLIIKLGWYWVEFRENVRAFFPQGQSKLSVIMRCPYY